MTRSTKMIILVIAVVVAGMITLVTGLGRLAGYEKGTTLDACTSEDQSTPCYWDAQVPNPPTKNSLGDDFIVTETETIHIELTGKDKVTVEGYTYYLNR